ncbi:hypothetical protein [Enterovibrio norvegicus]|uniref:hypothetical protein n=1 Tax=Enterovibrio norvegicus TaxID=188144 RepID=UPI000C860889|nr:hypothetical protein [Enterovibrio norvegicus]PMN74203.1 hypothetical protein BCT27_01095 [Enterovibrio norvegicus]
MAYKRPIPLCEWKIDEPDKELYLTQILDNETVLSAYGRYAHSSGSKSVSWQEFLDGEMNELVEKTMGIKVLTELLEKLKGLT